MRDTILTSLFLASATLTSASRLECLHTRSQELAAGSFCGHEGSLNYCFSNLPLSTQTEALSQELERCFVSAGCTPAESQIEASRVFGRCDGASGDLRRGKRQLSPESNNGHDSSPLAAAAREPILVARNGPLPTNMAAMNLPRQDNTPTVTFSDTPEKPSPCFTDSTSSFETCPYQTTGPSSGKRLPCFQTHMVTPKCRDGLICQSDGQGNPSCMYKHSNLGVAGTIIAIVFASAIAISVVAICFFCCRERREHRRIERAAEAARIAKEAKTQATAASKRAGTSITGGVAGPAVEGQPLMYQGGGAPSSPGHQQQQFPQQGGYGAGNPFADGQHDQHPLR